MEALVASTVDPKATPVATGTASAEGDTLIETGFLASGECSGLAE
ncbi:MAG: hypothetical protein NTW61_06955 [Candidatus Melainabacteria bacterium]|nr:hypothetical protein [Candidatus Melainabacteria bacterium]